MHALTSEASRYYSAPCVKYENIKTRRWKLKLIDAARARLAIVRRGDDKLQMKAKVPYNDDGDAAVPRVLLAARLWETVTSSSSAAASDAATRCLYFVSRRRLIYEVWPASAHAVWSPVLAAASIDRGNCVRVVGLLPAVRLHGARSDELFESDAYTAVGIQAERFRPPAAQVLIISLGTAAMLRLPGDLRVDISNLWHANISCEVWMQCTVMATSSRTVIRRRFQLSNECFNLSVSTSRAIAAAVDLTNWSNWLISAEITEDSIPCTSILYYLRPYDRSDVLLANVYITVDFRLCSVLTGPLQFTVSWSTTNLLRAITASTERSCSSSA